MNIDTLLDCYDSAMEIAEIAIAYLLLVSNLLAIGVIWKVNYQEPLKESLDQSHVEQAAPSLPKWFGWFRLVIVVFGGIFLVATCIESNVFEFTLEPTDVVPVLTMMLGPALSWLPRDKWADGAMTGIVILALFLVHHLVADLSYV